MNSTQQSKGLIEIAAALIIIVLLVAAGTFVFLADTDDTTGTAATGSTVIDVPAEKSSSLNSEAATDDTEMKTDQTQETGRTAPAPSPEGASFPELQPPVRDVYLTIDNIDEMPSNVASSFLPHIKSLMEKGTLPSEYGCITVYTIEKVSFRNVLGTWSPGPADPTSDVVCPGGGPMLWVLDENDTDWEDRGLVSLTLCTNIGVVYSDFLPSCLDENYEKMPNPNGTYPGGL